jgi:hypothetical protein
VGKFFLRFLLGFFLNSVMGMAIILPFCFIFFAFITFMASLPHDSSAWLIALATTALVVLVPFSGLNIKYSQHIKRIMNSFNYDKSFLTTGLVLYWIGAIIFFILPLFCMVLLAISGQDPQF